MTKNKTALTAEEKLANEILEAIKWMTQLRYDRKWSQEVAPLLVGYASLQTQEKDKEIAELKAERDSHFQDSQDLRNTNFDLQSTIESQQKEIEELKRAIEDEKKVCLRVMDYNSELESQLSEVTKERDKYKLAFFNTQQKF